MICTHNYYACSNYGSFTRSSILIALVLGLTSSGCAGPAQAARSPSRMPS